MSDREATVTREADESHATRETATDRDRERGLRGRVRSRAAALFSVRTFLLALALATVAVVAGNAVPLVGAVGGVLGVAGAGFVLGVAGVRAYPEVAAAGLLSVGAATLLDFLLVAFVAGSAVVAVGAGAGTMAAVVGHYLGRDLRAGFTRDL
jgi:hypothetical protein